MSTTKFRVFSKDTLKLANRIAIKRGYNRAIIEDYIESRPDTAVWAVTFHMPHEHAAGVQVPMHIRCMIRELFQENPPTLFVDTDLELFNMLATVELQTEEKPNPEPQEA